MDKPNAGHHPVFSTRYDPSLAKWAMERAGIERKSDLVRRALDQYIASLLESKEAA